MSLAKRIAAKRAEKERGFVDVDEWGDEDNPLRLYFHEVSAKDIEKVQRKHKDFLNTPTMSGMVEASATLSTSSPITQQSGSTTLRRSSGEPMRHVPVVWMPSPALSTIQVIARHHSLPARAL